MQELYYTSASSSLTLYKEDGTVNQWNNISSLIVCSSLYEIIAFSSSVQLVAFPIENTNLYYFPINISSPLTSSFGIVGGTDAFLNWSVTLIQSGSSNNFMSGSGGFIYSGSTYYVYETGSSNSGGFSGLLTSSQYTLLISGSNSVDDHTTYITLFDLSEPPDFPTLPGKIVINVSGSAISGIGIPLSASFYPSASHTYQAYLTLVGKG